MKRILCLTLCLILTVAVFVGCTAKGFDKSKGISIYSREEGSGTRGAFAELFGIEKKDASGKKVDQTVMTAVTTNSTQVMITSVESNVQGIGYISMGVLNDKIKGLSIDGVLPTVENINNGTYKISRPFNIATKKDLNSLGQDFVKFIMSNEGQQIVEDKGYIKLKTSENYAGTKPSGKLVVGGSSSVAPVMEKLVEAYRNINENANIELTQSDSTSGVNGVADGVLDIGMVSRELKSSELEKGIVGSVIAIDGIAVIVNNENPVDNLKKEDVMKIFTGELKTWSFIKD